MNVVKVLVDSPDDILATAAFGASAKVRLEASSDNITFVEDSTQTVVTGTKTYTFYDTDGTSAIFYRTRYSNSGSSNFSAYSAVFLTDTGYTTVERLILLSKAPSTDYAYLQTCADQANSWLISEVGRYYGPSTDTSRTLDVDPYTSSPLFKPVTYAGPELHIAGGLRSFTKCEMKLTSADTSWIDVTADVLLRPQSWDLLDGMAPDRLVFTDYPTLGYRSFFPGYAVARVTGLFGPASPPNALRAIADKVGWWLYQSRASGQGGIIGSSDTGELVQLGVLSPMDWRTIKLYRGVGPSLYAMPAF